MLRFPHPEPARQRPKVHPVFLPYAGCPQRCVYCHQPSQTGTAPQALQEAYDQLVKDLDSAAGTAQDAPYELAFYGGTFTALPKPWPERFLTLAAEHRKAGRISRVRCSTRPDALDPALLASLKALGLDLVEVGVQSFDDATLAASERGYSGETARTGCQAVKAAGLGLGIQLMTGLPGHTPEAWCEDVPTAIDLGPELVRLYPCLVLEDTPLAGLWRAGSYEPWPLELTLEALAGALMALWEAHIRVARIGLAEQEGLNVLAGPAHPALGQLARSRALFGHIHQRLAVFPNPPTRLHAPQRFQGEIFGHKGELAGAYQALGLDVGFWDEQEFGLE